MGRRAVETTPDRFAVDLDRMLSDVVDGVEGGMPQVVRKACMSAARRVRGYARQRFKGEGRYASGFSFRVRGRGATVSGEVGNRSLPGLAHLLEKGHATIGGGRVEGRPHISDAAEETFAELEADMDEMVGRVL